MESASARDGRQTTGDPSVLSRRPSSVVRRLTNRPLLLLLALFILLAPLVTRRIYASDEIKYFAYTHSLFFDHDLDFRNDYLHWYEIDPLKFKAIYTDLYQTREPLTGLPTNEAPIGTGLFWMPSYAVAHVFALTAHALGANIQADGWSAPYIWAVCLTSYLFGCIGLLLCWSLASDFFGKRLSAFAVVIIWFSTSLVFYTVIAPPWSHATSLLAVTLFIWYWHRTRKPEGRLWWQWAVLGALGGVTMLVREQDALFLVIPSLEVFVALVSLWRERKPGWLLLARHWVVGVVVMGAAAFVAFIPQLIAYKVITGRFGPSQVVSGKLNWTSPNFFNVLFSPEHGMITWTPIIAVCLIGLIFFWRRDRLFAGALTVAFFLQVYVAGSFLTWQSASSFGQRRFINCTVLFVLGLAAILSWAIARGIPRWLVLAVPVLFVLWNAGLLMQYALWCSPQRQGLDWAVVLKGQLEIPLKAPGLIWDFLFNRATFYRELPNC